MLSDMIYTIISIDLNGKPHLQVQNGPHDADLAFNNFVMKYKKIFPELNILMLIKGDHLTRSYMPGVYDGTSEKNLNSNIY